MHPNRKKLIALLEKHANKVLDMAPRPETYTHQVTEVLFLNLKKRKPGIEAIAEHFSMSVRSLQMKLKAEGTSYQELLNRIREQLAITCLKERRFSKGEIADLLGFAEISVFSRTFKKWTGKSPSEFQLNWSGHSGLILGTN
ncbi:MAG: helix-turn-helix transcriptional regulator [Bacteroidota bacterium]